MYAKGVTAGKFNPPHAGHLHMLRAAADKCDSLFAFVVGDFKFTAAERATILYEIIERPNVTFMPIENIYTDDDDPQSSVLWAMYTEQALGSAPDVVFTSEAYGERWAAALGADHIAIDPGRQTFPTSGTSCRKSASANRQFLAPAAMRIAAKRVVLVGSESSGTTTLTKQLAEHYNTEWVPEFGREIAEKARDAGSPIPEDGWHEGLFWLTSRGQDAAEERQAEHCSGILFCDTDSFATSIWWERYNGHGQPHLGLVEAGIKQAQRHDLYILTDMSTVPFEDDGTRDGESHREWMQKEFQTQLDRLEIRYDIPWMMVTGSKEERLAQAIKAVDKL